MKLTAPNYYTKFQCIAGNCRHNCCIGWEIDVDSDTLDYYNTIGGRLGQRLKDNIVAEEETAHFCLDKDGRCPFLNENDLCDIIIELGEEALCQICDDHPRFRNFYSDREEIGLGLSCEAAAKLVLSQQEKTQLISLIDDEEVLWEDETEFLQIRDDIWNILQNRTKPVEDRVKEMLIFCGIQNDEKSHVYWTQIYRNLEQLDPVRDKMLDALEQADKAQLVLPYAEWLENAFEQLICYFIYRHLTDSLDDGLFGQRLMFAVQSWRMVKWFAALHYNKYGEIDIEVLSEIVRIYSAEIEYSTENIEALLNIF